MTIKKLKSIFTLLIVFITCACCSNENYEAFPPYNDSYIQKFTDINQISVRTGYRIIIKDKTVTFDTVGKIPTDGFCIKLEAKSDQGFYAADAPQISNEYLKYCKLIDVVGDKNFKTKKRYYGVLDNTTSVAITDTLSSIIVTCDKEYNNIPANASLNNLITVLFDNPYVVVKNNYKDYQGADSYSAFILKADGKTHNIRVKGFPYAFVGDELSSIDWKTKPFIGNEWLFVFNQKPKVPDTYTFKIKVVKLNGEILEVTTKPTQL